MGLSPDSRGKGDSPSYFYLGENRTKQSQVELQVMSSGLEVSLQAWLVPFHSDRPCCPYICAQTFAVASSLLSQTSNLQMSPAPPHGGQLCLWSYHTPALTVSLLPTATWAK